ncbi:TonB-dependent receptor, partial [candidate division KSB1 bacterium]|nr:TonB-dependent receptor [candidate division KSB1 bacterium]
MKKSALLLLIAGFIIAESVSLYAQTAILRGNITDGTTGDSLLGANVILASPSAGIQPFGTSTNRSGDYEIRGIVPGTYTLSISFIGYETRLFEDFLLSQGETRVLNIAMMPSVLEAGEIEVSATRQSLNPLESSSSITILDTTHITAIQAMTPADHVIGLAGVDVVKTGVIQSNVALRGFNDVFSGSLLMMVDNRIGRIPSLRFNAFNFLPNSNEDIEQIEIIRGPASALYGPNSANGVLHFITKSPFGSEGFVSNFGFGQRKIVTVDFRYAGSYNNKLGYKITGSFMQGEDFPSRDAFEDSLRNDILDNNAELVAKGLVAPIDPKLLRVGKRFFLIEKLSSTGRLDYRVNKDMMLTFNGGINWASNIELTQIGAAQIDNWRYMYGQVQLRYNNLFMQTFVNSSNTGDTYLTRDGKDLVDRSKLYVYQIRNTSSFTNRQSFTYGFDALWTRPVTDGTINGSFEEDDDINEFGFYLISETEITENIKIISASRFDKHNRLDDPFISGRASLILTPEPDNIFRFSFNRAFQTPTAQNLFLDRLISPVASRKIPFNVWATGVPETGFTFKRDSGGGIDGLYMQASPFFRPPQQNSDFMAADATLMWAEAVEALNQIKGSGLDFVFYDMRFITPPTSNDVLTVLKFFNTSTGKYEVIDPSAITSIRTLDQTETNTFELGYKGIVKKKLLVNADLYFSKIKNFIGPLLLETPSVFFDNASLREYLLAKNLVGLNSHITVSNFMSDFPVGTVVPDQTIHPGDLLLTYRNFGDIDVLGLDLDFAYNI